MSSDDAMELWITGAGMVTSLGTNKDACFEAFCAGRSGVDALQAFDDARFRTRNAYEIKDRTEGDEPLRATRWLCDSLNEAVAQAGLTEGSVQIPVLVGTGLRELRSVELFFADDAQFDVRDLHFGGNIRERVPGSGAVYTLSNACAASNYALALAEDMIRLGQTEIALVAGCDAITESMYGLLGRVSPVVAERLQPFDRDRKGVLMGEGASAIVLETAEHARRRSAKPLARLRSVGLSCDAAHETAPDCAGIERAMQDAHDRAALVAEDVDVIFVHGTGTFLNDRTEGAAIANVFGSTSKRFVLSGIKAMTGHTSGASGLVGVVTALLALAHKRVPATLGLENPIDEIAGMRMPTEVTNLPHLRYAQVNAFGFGGVNAVVMLEGGPT
jgi:3-oxoacyl-[acyl-carrier-protein] synthase II